MQVVHKDKDEESTTRGTGPIGAVLCTRRVSRCVKGKHIRRTGSRRTRIQDSRRILAKIKKEFGEGEEESVKAAELRKLEQGGKAMEEFV